MHLFMTGSVTSHDLATSQGKYSNCGAVINNLDGNRGLKMEGREEN